MELDLDRTELAVCRLAPDAEVPSWALDTAGASLHAVVRTAAELSIVTAASVVPADVVAEAGWEAFAVRGPLDFGLTGVLADLARALADADVPIFAVSTHDTDWILVPGERTRTAVAALTAAGHRVHDSANGPDGSPVERALEPPPTAVVGFVGHATTGPVDRAVTIVDWPGFVRVFGGLDQDNELAWAVRLFFDNGGARCHVVRAAPSSDGLPGTAQLVGDTDAGTGLAALAAVPDCDVVVVPDAGRAAAGDDARRDPDVDHVAVLRAAARHCEQHRAVLLADAPADVTDSAAARAWARDELADLGPDVAAYFPRLRVTASGSVRHVGAAGAVAGVLARTDRTRGVWKAPAGTAAVVTGFDGLAVEPRPEVVDLTRLGLNCLRTLPDGHVAVWGARTLAGASSKWPYVHVRRLGLWIEETIVRGTAWTVFEPNDEHLWARLRELVDDVLAGLFAQGALQGSRPADAWFVRCDRSTTTQADVDRGVVHLVVGIAPVRPSEFVLVRVTLAAGR